MTKLIALLSLIYNPRFNSFKNFTLLNSITLLKPCLISKPDQLLCNYGRQLYKLFNLNNSQLSNNNSNLFHSNNKVFNPPNNNKFLYKFIISLYLYNNNNNNNNNLFNRYLNNLNNSKFSKFGPNKKFLSNKLNNTILLNNKINLFKNHTNK